MEGSFGNLLLSFITKIGSGLLARLWILRTDITAISRQALEVIDLDSIISLLWGTVMIC